MTFRPLTILTLLALSLCVSWPHKCIADKGPRIIRDAEIEQCLWSYVTPLLRAANLNPRHVKIYLVNDNSINAFVAGGQNIFVHTGLITRSDHPGQIIGVLAHEIGHIAGGHILLREQTVKNLSAEAIIGIILGAAAGILTENPDVGKAIALGGMQIAQRGFLQFTRTQEASADQAALKYLRATGQSPRGMLEFFETLQRQEAMDPNLQDPYVRTHPLNRERIESVRHHVKNDIHNKNYSAETVERYERIKAKIIAYTEDFRQTKNYYPLHDKSVAARYAHAIAYYRQGNLEIALSYMDQLLAKLPNDPFLWEMKGQIHFENGQIDQAVPAYQKALSFSPQNDLLKLSLAHALVELNQPIKDKEASPILHQILHHDRSVPRAWHLLSIVYGRQNDLGMTALTLAEKNYYSGDILESKEQIRRAEHYLTPNSYGWLQLQDLKRSITELEKDKSFR